MEAGLNNLIKKIASELFIKYESEERRKIGRSVDNILNRLVEYFDDKMDEAIVFGSFSRDTILPRKCDMNSDIDILVQFNTTDFDKLKPESYRNQLKKFADTNYPYSSVVKDHPSVVLELNHIKFDLVPAIFDEGIIYDSIEIPDKNGNWMETAPDRFNKQLTAANKKHQSIVKPIIRLIKFWNASNEYPYYSYELEEAIAEMDFDNDNYESGFLYAVQNLPSDFFTWSQDARIKALKNNAYKVSEYLESGELERATKYFKKIIPFDEI